MLTQGILATDHGFLNSNKFMATSVYVEAQSSLSDDNYLIENGKIYPADDATAEGIILGSYDVSSRDALISVINQAVVNTNRLPFGISDEAKAVLTNIIFEDNKY
jgi:hypothetical protein